MNLPRFLMNLIYSIARTPIDFSNYENFTSVEEFLVYGESDIIEATGYLGVYLTLFMGVAIASTSEVKKYKS